MKKLVNSLLYGSSKTKSYLWSMLVILGMALTFTILAIGMASLPMAIFALLAVGLDVAIYQSVSFRDIVKDGEEGLERRKIEKLKKKAEKLQEDNLEAKRKKTGDELVDELGIKEFSSNALNKKVVKGKEKKVEEEENETGEKKKKEDKKEKEEAKKESHIKKYNEKSIKKLMIKYKVKKEHRKVMIDGSKAFRIRQCPAYLWKNRKEVSFLLLEEEPRIIKIPIDRIREIGYKKMVEANPTSDYPEFMEPSLITKLFSEFLPQYKEGSYRGKMGAFKNLYTVTPDICITNTSAKNLLDIIEVEFAVHDEVTNSRNFSEYYKTAYQTNILWKDGVISTSEYKNRVKRLLTHVAQEPISKQIYDDLLQQLVQHKLITNEYASYYRELKK